MTELTTNLSVEQTSTLIESYAFDLGKYSVERLLQKWLNKYHASWIRLATIEALYLGRYKAISIEQILSVWMRRGNPNTHFTHEFERLICRKLPRHLSDITDFSTREERKNLSTLHSDDNSIGQKSPLRKNEPHLLPMQDYRETTPVKDSSISPNYLPAATPKQKGENSAGKTQPTTGNFKQTSKSRVSKEQAQELLDELQRTPPELIIEENSPRSHRKSDLYQTIPSEPSSKFAKIPSAKKISNSSVERENNASVRTSTTSKSKTVSAVKIPERTNWAEFAGEQTPIHQFVPLPDVSTFYNKLKAFGREKLEEQ